MAAELHRTTGVNLFGDLQQHAQCLHYYTVVQTFAVYIFVVLTTAAVGRTQLSLGLVCAANYNDLANTD